MFFYLLTSCLIDEKFRNICRIVDFFTCNKLFKKTSKLLQKNFLYFLMSYFKHLDFFLPFYLRASLSLLWQVVKRNLTMIFCFISLFKGFFHLVCLVKPHLLIFLLSLDILSTTFLFYDTKIGKRERDFDRI